MPAQAPPRLSNPWLAARAHACVLGLQGRVCRAPGLRQQAHCNTTTLCAGAALPCPYCIFVGSCNNVTAVCPPVLLQLNLDSRMFFANAGMFTDADYTAALVGLGVARFLQRCSCNACSLLLAWHRCCG